MDSTIHRVFYASSILILGLYVWAFANQAGLATLPPEFDASTLSYPVHADGRALAAPDELRFYVSSQPVGRTIQMEASSGDIHSVRLVAAHGSVFHLITWVTAFLFWVVATFVFAPRTERRTARYFYAASILYGLAIAVGLTHFPRDPLGPSILLPGIRILCLALVPTFFVFVSLTFPAEHEAVRRHPLLLPGLIAVALMVGLWHTGVTVAYVLGANGADWTDVTISGFVADLQLVLFFLTGVVLFYQSARRAELEREKKQVKWVLWGVSIGATPYILLWTLPRVLGLAPLVPLELARFLAGATPLAFSLAVARHQFLDIDLIIRRSLVYTGLACGLLLAYLLAGGLVGRWSETLEPGTARLVTFAAAAIAVGLFLPSRRLLQRWVDRTFFRIRYDYGLAMKALGKDLQSAASQRDVAGVLREALLRNLLPRRVAVLAVAPGGLEVAGPLSQPLFAEALYAMRSSGPGRPRLLAAAGSTSLAEIETDDFPPACRQAGFVLVQPVLAPEGTSEDRVLAALFVGPKRSERRFIEQDVQLLADMARDAAVVLDRLRLVQSVTEEALARLRLDELDRLKSDFLSRAAHDLRTPLTSIRWSAQNLIDGIGGPVTESQRESLRAVLVATDHLVTLVNNLLEISRMESGPEPIPMRPMRLDPVVDSVLTALRPIAAGRGIRLELRAGEPREILGNSEKLRQIVFNLVENAIKYSPSGDRVEIELGRETDGGETIVVRDHGPGVHEDEIPTLFDRFRQGRGSPHVGVQGLGLGLYVVRSLLQAMGGTVAVRNHPEGGAVFTCTIPAVRVEQESRA